MQVEGGGGEVGDEVVAAEDALGGEERLAGRGRGDAEAGGGDEREHVGVYGCEAGGVVEGCDGAGGFWGRLWVGDIAGVVLRAPADGNVPRDQAG